MTRLDYPRFGAHGGDGGSGVARALGGAVPDISYALTDSPAGRLAKESGYGPPCPVPMGVAVLPHDIVLSVRPPAERLFDIRHWTELPRGGHFAALEVPVEPAADIRAFFRGPVISSAP